MQILKRLQVPTNTGRGIVNMQILKGHQVKTSGRNRKPSRGIKRYVFRRKGFTYWLQKKIGVKYVFSFEKKMKNF